MACSICQLNHNCVCQQVPDLSHIPLQLALLLHEKEWQRETNTGRWLAQSLAHCSQHTWQRLEVDASLAEKMRHPDLKPFVLFPSEQSISVQQAQQSAERDKKTPLYIVLDGTWQEAQKMQRKSTWLNTLPQVHLNVTQESDYTLRRNQQLGHLCTLEVGAGLVEELGYAESGTQLRAFLRHYLAVFQADKSGHPFSQASL